MSEQNCSIVHPRFELFNSVDGPKLFKLIANPQGIQTALLQCNLQLQKQDIRNDGVDYLSDLPPEIIDLILNNLECSNIINLSKCSQKFYNHTLARDNLWHEKCHADFDVALMTRGQFDSFYTIYKLLYCSRILIGSYVYARYFNKGKLAALPPWLMVWAALSERPPLMKFGRHRVKRRISGHYFKRFKDLPYGQVKKVFQLDGFDHILDLPSTRMENGTLYFSWNTIRYAGRRRHGVLEFQKYILNKCYRGRGFIERNYQRVQGSDPLRPL